MKNKHHTWSMWEWPYGKLWEYEYVKAFEKISDNKQIKKMCKLMQNQKRKITCEMKLHKNISFQMK